MHLETLFAELDIKIGDDITYFRLVSTSHTYPLTRRTFVAFTLY